jgi:uncharacterized protein
MNEWVLSTALALAAHYLPYSVAAFVVGAVVGLTGVGGGSLMTPILIFGFGIKPHVAVGTDLLFAAFTKLGGAVTLARRRLVDWRIVGALSVGSIPAALVTVALIQHFGTTHPAVQKAITGTLGVALLLTAAATLIKALRKPVAFVATPGEDAALARHWALPVVFGALIGVLVSLTSVGAGAIGVTALMLLYPALPLPRIVAADIAYAVPLTLVAGLGHASAGSVDWALLVALLAGSLPGIWLGTRFTARAPQRAVRALLSVLLAIAGVKLVAL